MKQALYDSATYRVVVELQKLWNLYCIISTILDKIFTHVTVWVNTLFSTTQAIGVLLTVSILVLF